MSIRGQALRAGRMASAGVLLGALVAPWVRAEEVRDAAGHYRITLPKRWRVLHADERDVFAAHEGWFSVPTDEPDAALVIKALHGHARPELAHHALHVSAGPIEPDTDASGDDFVQSCGLATAQSVARWGRYVSCGDGVLVAEVQFSVADVGLYDRKIEKMLGTFVASRMPEWQPPDGCTPRELAGASLWSDVKSKRTIGSAAERVLEGWNLMKELLPGAPYRGGRPRVVVLAEQEAFASTGSPSVTAAYAYVEVSSGVIHVSGPAVKKPEAIVELWRAGAAGYLHEYLGGVAPPLVEAGLTQYVALGMEARGKLASPRRTRAADARTSVARTGRTLVDWLDGVRWQVFVDDDGALAEAWAWCWYLRHEAAEPARAAFDEYVASLRVTGSPRTAREVWNDVDTSALSAEFHAWIERWRP